MLLIPLLAGGIPGVELTKKNSISFCGNTNSFDLLIITAQKFHDALQPLKNHKEQHELLTKIVTLTEIYNEDYFSVTGRDNAEKIKYFIKNTLETWNVSYVLLVGDLNLIPMRRSMVQCSWYDFEYVITDLYYADIYDKDMNFCSWDSNQNDLFGEFSWEMSTNEVEYIDDVDLYPDVGIGRLPCSNVDKVNTVVEKIITYETTTYGSDWFHRMLLLGGDTFPSVWEPEGEAVTEYTGSVMANFSFEPVRLWTSLDTFKPVKINKEISVGAGFISFSGHGKAYEISTNTPYKEQRTHYFSPYLRWLSNGDKLPVVFFDACKTAKLDFNLFGIKIPCFAWMMVKQQEGGSIASIGATRMGYGGYAEDPMGGGTCRLHADFFDAYEPGILLSDMLTKAQSDYLDNVWKDCLTLEEFILIGDPSLKIGGYET
ncbi:MAG: hypothetical protein KGY50_00020 [Candidatus Thermoplasmatota archaeon]|nr:hypothetical protein [Candidatus Thermoplasmatota archaeon]